MQLRIIRLCRNVVDVGRWLIVADKVLLMKYKIHKDILILMSNLSLVQLFSIILYA